MVFGLVVERGRGPYTVLAVHGDVDISSAPRLREKFVELVTAGSYQIVVDLEGVDFLDSTGLGVLFGALKRLRSGGGDMTVLCTQERVLEVFELTGFSRVVTVIDSLESLGR